MYLFIFLSVFPLFCVLSWTATMALYYEACSNADGIGGRANGNASSSSCGDHNSSCWEGYTEQPYQYIISIPMILALAVRVETRRSVFLSSNT